MTVESELFWTMFALKLDGYWSAQCLIGTTRLYFWGQGLVDNLELEIESERSMVGGD